MKKIMFNDKYGLTQAVLEGRKTHTRRIAYDFRQHVAHNVYNCALMKNNNITYMDGDVKVLDELSEPLYKVDEEVAIAQSYDDVYMEKNAPCPIPDEYRLNAYNKGFNKGHKGWKNKMFVSADDMPFRIKINNIRVERLQDISEDDCLKEGVVHYDDVFGTGYMIADPYNNNYRRHCYTTPQKAFAALIDKTCGKGAWESNPWVFVYDFELIK